MIFAIKALITILAIYAAFRLSGIGIAWLKEFFDRLSPRYRKDD